MTGQVTAATDGEAITLFIPLTFPRRGGRKAVVAPDGAEVTPLPQVDTALVRALARAFRWQRMLDEGVHATLAELAAAERVSRSHVSRLLRLTLLAPEIVEAVLDGRQAEAMRLEKLLGGFPVEWAGQGRTIHDQPFSQVSRTRDATCTKPR
jgi:ParB-like chromosome segregation protein Spo0J